MEKILSLGLTGKKLLVQGFLFVLLGLILMVTGTWLPVTVIRPVSYTHLDELLLSVSISKEIFMKNKTLRYTSLSVLTLLAALTLVACGGKTDKNTSSSNQKETTSKVTTESASKTEAGQKEEQKSE